MIKNVKFKMLVSVVSAVLFPATGDLVQNKPVLVKMKNPLLLAELFDPH